MRARSSRGHRYPSSLTNASPPNKRIEQTMRRAWGRLGLRGAEGGVLQLMRINVRRELSIRDCTVGIRQESSSLRDKRILVAAGVAAFGAVAFLVALGLLQLLLEPDRAELDCLFVDAQALAGPSRSFEGTIVRTEEYALEPGYLTYWVRTADGSQLKIILNQSSRIRWPGTTKEIPAGDAAGPDRPASFYDGDEGRKIAGRLRSADVGPVLRREAHLFLVNARIWESR